MRPSLLALVFVSVLLSGCTQLFFQPSSSHGVFPSDIGYEYKDVYINSSNGVRIHGWLVEPALLADEQPKGVVYFLHGNAQNISWHINGARWLLESGYRVFALDYRGYGRSTGFPSLPGAYDDLSAGFEWFKDQVVSDADGDESFPVILFGQSLGASLSINWLAAYPEAEKEFTHIVLDSAFSSFGSVAREVASLHWLSWAFQYPAEWFLSDEIDPVDSIPALSAPLLLVHSQNDRVVGYQHSTRLLEAAGPNASRISGTRGHIASLREADIRKSALMWLSNP